ncbi:5-methyltetrahydropteroyltriglutamate--homocysteine S-methyltransferase [Treponema zioleckii]|uniref:5-methyltetrahydropteroyltriglutamate-- homocysteine S-methyltransferase n=1 Tax=Treponema zioleckii TaxID=331680 RepID=UPI00168BEE99|nr:5-methyltetrahydropteroyltriglutamate--homocysteine S-methyltransferase [Treponema zioleckii]
MANKTHFDVVGSFLRPEELKKARADFDAGRISNDEFTKIKHELIKHLVEKQKSAGLHYITDGEYNRKFWHLDFFWGFEGIAHKNDGGGVQFAGEVADLEATFLTGKLSAKAHPFIEDFKFLKSLESDGFEAKQTIPAPAQLFQQLLVPANYESTRKYYPTNDELIEDIAKAYTEVIKQFYDAGCRTLQFDDCTWGAIVGNAAAQRYKSLGLELKEVKEQLLKVNNLAINGKPKDLQINTHICRGNYHSTYFTSGPYDAVANYVFAKENVNTLYLEYDDERSGGFSPLASVSPDKKVVLGLITTKNSELEDKQSVIERIHEAEKYISLERLSISPQCGFASCEIGNKLTEEEQWAKIHLVREIAEEVWN